MIRQSSRRRGPGKGSPRDISGLGGGHGVLVLLAVDVLLMGFSIAAALLAQPALAAIAGTACVSLAKKIARRCLA